jgi:acetyl esterase
MALDRRVRLLGAGLRRATGPVATMTGSKRRALRGQKAPRHLTNLLNGSRVPSVTTTDITVHGASGPLRTRVYRPPSSGTADLPLVVAFHGGGWMFGNLDTAEWLWSEVAARVPAVVVAGTYRLAPEHPAPAALNDAFAITSWAANTPANVDADPKRLAIMGESSGATLAASVALMARDRAAFALQLQALIYPITDLTLSSPSVAEMSQEPILSSSDLRAYVDAYLGPDGCPADPYVSPHLAADHRALPPALVIGADHDPLRDDARRYATRLQACGVPVRAVEMPDSPHGFFSFPHLCHASGPALEVLVDELRRTLGVKPPQRASGPPDDPPAFG